MRTHDEMKTKIETGFQLLCDHYQLKQIPVKWTSTKRGKFRGHRMLDVVWGVKVYLGVKCWRGVENSMLHEFTHYLTLMRYKSDCKHGDLFIRTLKEVVGEWYKDPTKYDWNTEYRHIAKYAIENGLTTKTERERVTCA